MTDITARELAVAIFMAETGGAPPSPFIMRLEAWRNRERTAAGILAVLAIRDQWPAALRDTDAHTETTVDALPRCDFCGDDARYDGKTHEGAWAYMCESDFRRAGIGLGLGRGQRLVPQRTQREGTS